MSRDSFELNLTDEWVKVSDDSSEFCSVIMLGAFSAIVRVAREKPATGVNEGAPLSALHRDWSIDDLASGQKVWARAAGVSARVTVN